MRRELPLLSTVGLTLAFSSSSGTAAVASTARIAIVQHSAHYTFRCITSPARTSRQGCRRTARTTMYPLHLSRLRGRLLALSTRAAFATTAGVSLGNTGPNTNNPNRTSINSTAGPAWLGKTVAARAAGAGAARIGRPLSFRGPSYGSTDGPIPAALDAWPWKNAQGILVSPMDTRQYRWLVLPNGLQVMVISDPKATKAAAAMSVDVGAASDPPGLPGLAHFLEHMLFLGTSKYPKENAYKSYLSKHGGRSNASTSMDDTTFKFEVGAEHLRGALDIFSQFFVSPLFSESSTGRELLAVDSEDSKNRTNDGRRILQVLKALADSEHPYSKFSTGNLKTLKDDVPEGTDTRTELLAFHHKHYHALNMALVVLGKEDLDHLEGWARECFQEVRGAGATRKAQMVAAPSSSLPLTDAPTVTSDINARGRTNGRVPPLLSSEESGVRVNGDDIDVRDAVGSDGGLAAALAKSMASPWGGKVPLGVMVGLEPLRDLRKLMVQWPMPPVRRLWRNSPTRILSHLMGHEGPGSLFATLQDRGLATSVSSGLRTAHDDFCLFQVDIALTEEGQERWEEVAALVHAHARLVRELPAENARRAWEEARDMSAIYLRFQQETPPYAAAPGLARRLQLYPSKEALSAGGVLDLEMDPALYSAFADYLRPENTLTWRLWKRKNEAGNEVEKHGAKGSRTTDVDGCAVAGGNAPEVKEERW